MSKPMDHIAYLSQEIGPRPAGTEEEQQAALYITERFQKETHLPVEIEDFTCSTDAEMPKLICYLVTILATVLALFVPVATIPAIVATLISAAIFMAESFDKPILSQLFMKGVSQNVVAKYEPTYDLEGAGARRRKVILVANYDSGKVRHDLLGFMPAIQRPLQYAVMASMCLLPFVILIRNVVFAGQEIAATAFMVVAIVLAVVVAIPAVFIGLHKAAAYNEGANSNASGVAVMLEVARRLGSGEAAADTFADGIMHDEATARAAGVVPEGATISYEDSGYDAAKKRLGDVADNLVQVKDDELPESASDADLSKARKETRSALASAPIDTLAAAAAKAAELHEAAEAAEAARIAQEEAEREAAARAAAEAAEAEEALRAAAEAVLAEAQKPPAVPDWYLKATEKARKSEPLANKAGTSYRSRYADFPDEREVVAEDAPVIDEEVAEIQEIPGSVAPAPYEDDFAMPVAQDDAAVAADEVVQGDEPSETVVESVAAEEAPAAEAAAEQLEPVAAEQLEPVAVQPDNAAAESAPASFVVQNLDVAVEEGMTTAMPAVADAGELDLDAMRAAAEAPVAEEPTEPAAPAAEATAGETSRMPQLMYYTAPEDRSEELRDRARKERSVVTLTADEVQDMTVAVEEAAPVASDAQVTTIPASVDAPTMAMPAVEVQPAEPAAQPAAAASTPEGLPIFHVSQPVEHFVPTPGQAPYVEEGGKVIEPRIPVVDLPSITLPAIKAPDPKPISFEELRQRAPLASVAESDGKGAAKELLSISLPSIDSDPADADATVAFDGTPKKKAVTNNNVSVTGSFAPVGAIGAEPVGDKLIENVAPEDIYVDDADDSVFEEEFTETGAFAGPGYVEMPQSRMGRFFGKFRKKKQEEESAHEWLDVDEDFDAREVGKKRGSWESFREDDDWEGGAFDGLKARMPQKGDAEDDAPARPERLSAPAVSHDAFAAALAAANAAAEAKGEKIVEEDGSYDDDDVQQIYSFAAGDINTEVWFVALGSELADNGGIKAFLAEHASDMRGAVIVNLESLGAGHLSYLEKEGAIKQASCSARMKRFIRKASQATGVNILGGKVDWRESAASYAQKHRMQAMTLAGMDGNKPAFFGQADDIIENVNPDALDRSADVVVELLKSI